MKKSTKRFLSLISAVLILSMLLGAFAACNKKTGDEEETTIPEETTTGDSSNTTTDPSTTIDYTVQVVSAGGLYLEGVKFEVYEGDDLKAYGEIDNTGSKTVKLPAGGSYKITLSNVPEGYEVKDSYTFSGTTAKIILTSSVIEDPDIAGVTYTIGSVMHDFTVTTTDGKVFNLAAELEEKQCVMINFFYTTCSPCVTEFPYINTVASRYTDSVSVIAMDPLPTETEDTVKAFKETYNLSLDMAKTDTALANAFGVSGFPTSVFIDRFGVVCLIEIGGMPSETPFTRAFDYFTHPQYVQKLFNSMEELTPIEKPNVDMPSSDEIKNAIVAGDMNVTFHPEENPKDKEYAWPFIINPENPNEIMSSNSFKEKSFAIIYADVELKAGEAIAIDYFTETEGGADILYVLVDGKDIYQISGVSYDWKTCYPFVATKDGTYELAFTYLKDSDTDRGNDVVRLKNLRVVPANEIDVPTYIPRYAATDLAEDGMGYLNYATVVYNANDGYYHVNTEDGPLLLANLMGSTPFSTTSINDLAYGTAEGGYSGLFVYEGKNLYWDALDGATYNLQNYANFSINGYLYGYVPVTQELRDMLEICVDIAGEEKGNPNQWLQICSYYDVYGTEEQLDNPIRGLANFSAYEAVETTDENNVIKNSFYYDHSVMPRGYRAKFTPEKSGVYLIKSYGHQELDGWIFTDNSPLDYVYEYQFTERVYKVEGSDDMYYSDMNNVYMLVYLTAGKNYYISIALLDPTLVGGVDYSIHYISEHETVFKAVSPGPFTASLDENGNFNEIIADGVYAKLGDDGYYHAIEKDGSLGSLIYADFINTTYSFPSQSILQLIDAGAFNFELDEIDSIILTYVQKYTDSEGNLDHDACVEAIKAHFGEESYPEQQVKDVLNGVYKGSGKDYTERMREIVAEKLINSNDETNGCIIVDAELANILQLLMDKYTFKGVETSWRKLCYYYANIDSDCAI